MIVMDIAEWIANLLILGIAVVIWGIGMFIVAMMVSIISKFIKQHIQGESK